VIDILVQVLSGLVAAHEKGIVHRDIKPENVFLTRRVGCPPLVKLLDFGVSKMIVPPLEGRDDDLDLTRTGMVMGTPYYMAPEQARGDRNLDARVDLYACGVILYEALTGRRPFTAANYNALLLQILGTDPRPARELRPALPSGFDTVLDKAMARSRDDRYRAAADLQRDLQALRDRHNGTPVSLGAAARPLRAEPPALQPSRAAPEPTPSSVEIPIVFSGETPQSGESLPVDERDFWDEPDAEFADDGQASDAQTTQKRGPEFERALANARQAVRDSVRDTDATGRPAMLGDRESGPAVRDTDPTGRPAALVRRKGIRARAANPDDTLTDEGEGGEPTQLMPTRERRSLGPYKPPRNR
jgi:serine/threonine-protein kinase